MSTEEGRQTLLADATRVAIPLIGAQRGAIDLNRFDDPLPEWLIAAFEGVIVNVDATCEQYDVKLMDSSK